MGRETALKVACLAAVAACLPLASCTNGDGGTRSGFHIGLTFTPPASGLSDVVWLAEGGHAGEILQVDVVGRDISSEFDGFNLEIQFDPLTATAQSVTSGGILDDCAPGLVLKTDNIANGNANQTGTILVSEAIAGAMPVGCTVSGLSTLTKITFRAAGRGSGALDFVPYNGDPNAPTGSRLYRTQPSVPAIPLTFFDSGATIDVTR